MTCYFLAKIALFMNYQWLILMSVLTGVDADVVVSVVHFAGVFFLDLMHVVSVALLVIVAVVNVVFLHAFLDVEAFFLFVDVVVVVYRSNAVCGVAASYLDYFRVPILFSLKLAKLLAFTFAYLFWLFYNVVQANFLYANVLVFRVVHAVQLGVLHVGVVNVPAV